MTPGAPPATLTLTRLRDTGKETMGVLRIGDGGDHPMIYTLEDTWKDNANGVSCIPPGTYTCVPHGWEEHPTVTKTRVWRLINTGRRLGILIHSGNTNADTEGCILVGLSHTENSVRESIKAIEYLRHIIGRNSFTLIIEGVK